MKHKSNNIRMKSLLHPPPFFPQFSQYMTFFTCKQTPPNIPARNLLDIKNSQSLLFQPAGFMSLCGSKNNFSSSVKAKSRLLLEEGKTQIPQALKTSSKRGCESLTLILFPKRLITCLIYIHLVVRKQTRYNKLKYFGLHFFPPMFFYLQ